MSHPEILTIKLYRQAHGDVDYPDVTQAGPLDAGIRQLARTRLLSAFGDKTRRAGLRPTAADVVNESWNVLATYHVCPKPGSSEIECVEAPVGNGT